MDAEQLLTRLGKLRRTGADRYVARCPAQADRGPSLAIRELADGHLLLHCFASCPTTAVLAV